MFLTSLTSGIWDAASAVSSGFYRAMNNTSEAASLPSPIHATTRTLPTQHPFLKQSSSLEYQPVTLVAVPTPARNPFQELTSLTDQLSITVEQAKQKVEILKGAHRKFNIYANQAGNDHWRTTYSELTARMGEVIAYRTKIHAQKDELSSLIEAMRRPPLNMKLEARDAGIASTASYADEIDQIIKDIQTKTTAMMNRNGLTMN